MKRLRVVATVTGLALVAASLPLAFSAWVSWRLAVQVEQDALHDVADRALQRADRAYRGALGALGRLQASRLPPCSPEHVRLMRSQVVGSYSVDQIGYFHEGRLQCTSWGAIEGNPAWGEPDHTTADGADLRLDVRPHATYGRRMLSLRVGDYDALMDPGHFAERTGPDDAGVAVATADGALLVQEATGDARRLQSLLRDPRTGMDDSALFATARSAEWLAVATAPRTQLRATFLRQLRRTLPVGIPTAALFAAFVVWLARRRMSLHSELARAIDRGELYVVYQPIIELATGICVGAEALVRWRRPDGTEVRPDLFIPLAEESGLIEAVTDTVIEHVIHDMRGLLVGDRSAHIAINLAPDDIVTGRALKVVERKLSGTGIANQQIWLEATERGFMDLERARTVIAAARHSGHAVAIDDFGVGYSNLQYLAQLPLDALKIDKSFIDAIGTGAATSPVTGHIIDMAKALGLFVVAEGVETETQMAYLHARQVEFAQGWLISKALPPDAFLAFHRRRMERYGRARENMQNDRNAGRDEPARDHQ